MQEEQELPIDIHTNKLLDWLISRRHCNRNWSDQALVIREKINNAIQDMPAHPDITSLLTGTYINYFHCKKIVEILKETECESKNIFGRYSSQRMKDWVEIVSLYEKDNVYLAEAAHMLIQNVKYEIPAIRRQMIKLQQMQQEWDKKCVDYGKLSKDFKDKYNATCRQLGIKGTCIRSELGELIKDIPSAYESVMSASQQLNDAVEFYKSFVEFVSGKSPDNILPMLTYLKNKGNTTVYELRHGLRPISIEEPKLNLSETKETLKKQDSIDFGEDNIDFGDDKIDFGDEQIDFGENNVNLESFEVIDTTNGDGVARHEEALTVLDLFSTRISFLNDLCELEAFLEQRIQEMQVEGDLLSMNQFQTAPAAIQSQTVSKIKNMITLTKNVTNLLNDVKLKQLFTMKESPRYIDRLMESLNQNLIRADKMIQNQEIAKRKGKEAIDEEVTLNPKLNLIIDKTKELQKLIETDISKKYKNRHVNIMGSINAILQSSD